ncbi:hypothetical protein [Spirosoma areae]
MMKRYLLYVLLGLVVLPAWGQGVTDYYRLPEKGQHYNRLLTRYGGPAIQNRWYVALDGFIRTDRAHLDNSFDGLIESDLVGKAGWGAVIGWAYRERWAVEAGYARMPIHTQVSIGNTRSPLQFRYANNRNSFMLRGKRLVLSTSKPWLRSGFWLSGGAWVVPNNGQQEGTFSLSGTRRSYWEAAENFQLTSRTHINNQLTTLAEVGAEYNVRLGSAFELGVSVRKFWGLGSSITTDLSYTPTHTPSQQAQLQGTGNGMSYGLTLRYSFDIRRKLPNVLDVQGKQRVR